MVSETVLDTTDATFEADVLQRSSELPVVVDFWAPWCGPCRILSPILESLAAEFAGKVQVVKLNTDENPRAASAFGISGIPAVIAFRDGRPLNQFVGALPEEQVRAFFEGLQPSEAALKVREALAMLEQDQRGAARLHLESALQDDPEALEAGLLLAALIAEDGEFDRARELAERWPGEPAAKRVLGALTFQQRAAGANADDLQSRLAADESDAEAHYLLGCLLASQDRWEDALEHLLQAVKLDRDLDEDGARLRMLDAFAVLGDGDPLTQTYRRKLGQVLF